MIFSSPPPSSSIFSTPTGRTFMTAPGTIGAGIRDQHVDRVAVVGQRMRDEAVIAGIAHRRVQEAVDEQRAGILVHLVFDRLAADRHLDDDVDVVAADCSRSGWRRCA